MLEEDLRLADHRAEETPEEQQHRREEQTQWQASLGIA